MSNAITTLFVVALMLVAVLSWSQATFSSVDSGAQSWKEMVKTTEDILRTDIETVGAQMQAPFLEVLVHNSGQVHLSQFTDWDVFVEYYDGNDTYGITRLEYTEDSSPSGNQWTVATIYADESLAQQEVFEPGILSPEEVMLVKLRLDPQPGISTINRATLASPNGVVTFAQFQG